MKKNYPYFITAKFENVITNSRSKKPLIKFMWAYIVLVLIMFSTTYSLNAQFSKLYDFKAGRDSILKGATFSKLITDGSSLFGMTAGGGFYNSGTIFKINPDGSGFQRLLEFDGKTQGGNPNGYLTIVGDSLYGITQNGGFYNVGVIFKISKDGSGYQKLYDFDGTFSGGAPNGSLTLVNDTLYGMTTDYGSSNSGTIFKINRSGQGFQKLYDFDFVKTGTSPLGSLTQAGDSLYGMTTYGGSNYSGTLFKIGKNGKGYQKLLDFDGTNNGAMTISFSKPATLR